MNIADAIRTVVSAAARRGNLVGLTPQDVARELIPEIEVLTGTSKDPEVLLAIEEVQRMGYEIGPNHFFVEAVARALVVQRVMGRPRHTSHMARRRGFCFGVVKDEESATARKAAVRTSAVKTRSSGRIIAATGQQ